MKTASERYAALVRLVESRTVTRAQPPLLLPAGPYFDLAGEEFGRNLLLTVAAEALAETFVGIRPDAPKPLPLPPASPSIGQRGLRINIPPTCTPALVRPHGVLTLVHKQ